MWCWRRLLRVPWTVRRSNQSILKEISPEYSLEALLLKLKPQYFGHLMQRADSLEKTLRLGKTEGRKRRRWGRMRRLESITDSMDMSFNKLREIGWRTGKPGVLQSSGVSKSRTLLSDWTTITNFNLIAYNLSFYLNGHCLPYWTAQFQALRFLEAGARIASLCPICLAVPLGHSPWTDLDCVLTCSCSPDFRSSLTSLPSVCRWWEAE